MQDQVMCEALGIPLCKLAHVLKAKLLLKEMVQNGYTRGDDLLDMELWRQISVIIHAARHQEK